MDYELTQIKYHQKEIENDEIFRSESNLKLDEISNNNLMISSF